MRLNNIIDFQNHLADLSSQLELLFLGIETFVDSLSLHVVGSSSEAVHPKVRVTVFLLLCLQVGKIFNS